MSILIVAHDTKAHRKCHSQRRCFLSRFQIAWNKSLSTHWFFAGVIIVPR